jgi:hypothetical protein
MQDPVMWSISVQRRPVKSQILIQIVLRGRMGKPSYYVLWSRFWLISLCVWTTKIRTVVYVAMDVDIILLGDSMKSYKLPTFSCTLYQLKPPNWIFNTNKESLPCTSFLSVPWSSVYSPPGKVIQYIFMLLIILNIINLRFSVMGYTCTCLDSQRFHLAGPTLACCSQQSKTGTIYTGSSLIQVCSDCRRQIEWLLTWLKWTVRWCG